MNSRDRILTSIREARGRTGTTPAGFTTFDHYIAAHARGPIPEINSELASVFRERATELASAVRGPISMREAPSAVAAYLEENRLPCKAVAWPQLLSLDWAADGIAVEARPAGTEDLVGITGAFCAIAETGTLMLTSGEKTPATVSLLPETHIALVPLDRVVASMEDAWDLLRSEHANMPRSVNFVSGPSRTADIEQTVTLGAHGPYRVLTVLVTDNYTALMRPD